MQYMIFYTGLASMPNSIGLKCITTNEIICQIETALPSGKKTYLKYEKFKNILNKKYSKLVGNTN